MKMRVTAKRGLRLHATPSVWGRVVDGLPYGIIVDITEKRGVWGHVAQPEGWASLNWLEAVDENTPAPHPEPQGWIDGLAVDISKYQRRVEGGFWCGRDKPWAIIIKATQRNYTDHAFCWRWPVARAYFSRRAVYHFFDPDWDGGTQATVFLDAVKPQQNERAALDLEWLPRMHSVQWVAEQVHVWLDAVDAEFGSPALIYTRRDIIQAIFGERPPEWLTAHPVWPAYYANNATQPLMPPGWKRWAMWQYTSKRKWPGITNYFGVNTGVDTSRVAQWFANEWQEAKLMG